jgi:hypothetical protein
MENLSQGSQIVLDTICHVDLSSILGTALTDLLSFSHLQLIMDNFRQPLESSSNFQAAELRGSLHQLMLSQNSQLVLCCG